MHDVMRDMREIRSVRPDAMRCFNGFFQVEMRRVVLMTESIEYKNVKFLQ